MDIQKWADLKKKKYFTKLESPRQRKKTANQQSWYENLIQHQLSHLRFRTSYQWSICPKRQTLVLGVKSLLSLSSSSSKIRITKKTGFVLLLSNLQPFMQLQQYSTVLVFLHIKTQLQHIHGQSLVIALCMVYLTSHKYTAVAVLNTSFIVLLMFTCTAAGLTFRVGSLT